MENQHALDDWMNAKPLKCTSLQIRMPSGTDVHKDFHHRLSSDQRHHVSTLPYSPHFMSVESAFYAWLAHDEASYLNCVQMLSNHPKIIARKVTLAKLLRRNPTTEIRTEQRIPLPRKCRHQLMTIFDGETTFTGDKVVKFPNGETHVFIEYVQQTNDDYCGDKKDASIHHGMNVPTSPPPVARGFAAAAAAANATSPAPAAGTVPASVSTNMDTSDDNLSADMAATADVPPQFAKVVDGYDGAAERDGRSVKSKKRAAAKQDDADDDEIETVYSEPAGPQNF